MFATIFSLFGKAAAVLSLFGILAVTGCGVSGKDIASPAVLPIGNRDVSIQGFAHGGAYPIQYATIRLMETQTNGYGGAAKQLAVTQSDTLGNFNFGNNLSCDAGQYAYITVSGGQTVSGKTNNNVVQVGAIGSCSVDLAYPQNVNVWVSELSTIAAAYALGNFMTIAPNDDSGQQIVNISAPAKNNSAAPGCTPSGTSMTCTAAGLANGFANAFNLIDSVRYDGTNPTGKANSAMPNSSNKQAVLPQALVNTLGNILQSCVDSAGGGVAGSVGSYASDGTHCGDLFLNATPPNLTAPQNTLQVALNMAKYPTNNVDALFNLQPRGVFFTPDLVSDIFGTSGPLMSFTLSIFYNGTGISGDAGIPYPVDVALDAGDNAYVLYSKDGTGSTYAALDGFSAAGTGLFAGAQLTAMPNPSALALDSAGHAWVTNDTASGGVSELFTSGSNAGTVAQTIAVPFGYAAGLALDMTDSLWVARDAADANQSFFRFSSANSYGASTLQFPPLLNAPVKRIVVDSNQNLWGVTSSLTSNAVAFGFGYGANASLASVKTATLTGTGGFGVAITNGLEAYFPVSGQLNSASGSTLGGISPNSAGSAAVSSAVPSDVAIDGGGNIFWTDFESSGKVYMMVPSTGTGTVTASTLPSGEMTSFQPCFAVSGECHVSAAGTNLRGMAIDSSGAMWYVSDSGDYAVVQTLGMASPTWPLISYAHAASIVQ